MSEKRDVEKSLIQPGISLEEIQSRIIILRGTQVILDRELAKIYQVEVGYMNRQVKRNKLRFPQDFIFQLSKEENDSLKCHFGISKTRGGDRTLPYAFTEQGVSMLSGILRSEMAIQANILIMRAFVAMRHFLLSNASLFQRMDRLEYRQLETDHKIEQLFDKLEENVITPQQNIFFDGQVFDAYKFVSQLIEQADVALVLIDNYIDVSVLTMLDKRKLGVKATIYTQKVDAKLRLDINKHNAQYQFIDVQAFNKAHDRFLIVDDNVYHIGASLKDLGKKWFAFSLMKDFSPQDLLSRISI